MTRYSLMLIALFFTTVMNAQPIFEKSDTLRGSLNENRDWFDILKYDITVTPNFDNKTIQGTVAWKAKVNKQGAKIQVDLQQPLVIDSIVLVRINPVPEQTINLRAIPFSRENNIALVAVPEKLNIGDEFMLWIAYHGKPREAVKPPWDGGWIWKKDSNGKPWVSVACQGLGASVWYPCKDHQSDEPEEGATVNIYIPDSLGIVAIANGRLVKEEKLMRSVMNGINNNNLINFKWEVKNPINNYNIIPYIGDYITWNETYPGLKGALDVSYYALREDSLKARLQFTQVPKMLKAFEYWMGPYPFYEDGYKLIQAPHLGMEHQSAVAYGNKFENGYLGRDLSGSGWGKKWDFIIVHESGHEWFANNISTKDIADNWVHEGFTNYTETLFTEYYYGIKAGNEYNYGTRKGIANRTPIIGPYGVNGEGSSDMYPKGGNLLHTIRHSINNDKRFRAILTGLNETFYHKTVTTKEIEDYISQYGKFNFSKVFDQYLRTTQIPVFSYTIDRIEKLLTYQWRNCVPGFDLPLNFNYFGNQISLRPIEFVPQKISFKNESFDIDEFIKELELMYYVKAVEERY